MCFHNATTRQAVARYDVLEWLVPRSITHLLTKYVNGFETLVIRRNTWGNLSEKRDLTSATGVKIFVVLSVRIIEVQSRLYT